MLLPCTKKFLSWVAIIGATLIFGFSNCQNIYAQSPSSETGGRQYWYDKIDVTIRINEDTTFDVEERQTFHYQGKYNLGWRSIPFRFIDAVSDIKVVDNLTGRELEFSSRRLNKLESSSWGKYTSFKESGRQNIEWYYNLQDTSYEWILRYKVHGGLGFFGNIDKLSWNVFTDYDVGVDKASVKVFLPQAVEAKLVKYDAFRSMRPVGSPPQISKLFSETEGVFMFESGYFEPREALTVEMSWPSGLVRRSAYWLDFLKIYWAYSLSLLIVLGSLIYSVIHWYVTEKHRKGRGTIVAQYEPPRNLRPAMAELITKEKITDKAWTATVVDLSVRGYVRIKEDSTYWVAVFKSFLKLGLIAVFPLIVFIYLSDLLSLVVIILFLFFFVGLRFILADFFNLFKGGQTLKDFFFPKEYIVEKVKPFENDPNLEDYEKLFLAIIFGSKNSFSTKEIEKASQDRKRSMFEKMQKLKEKLYKETEKDTEAYEVGASIEKKRSRIFVGLVVVGFFAYLFSSYLFQIGFQYLVLIASVILSGAWLWARTKYEARLSEEGHLLKEDWLGFKLYLETAEKYRLQNLTPETFEKYLPYAIIFGVERAWGRAFEGINMPAPQWYGSSFGMVGGMPSFSAASSFSSSAFSASFSSSFSSVFSGAVGGGGGSGGGGGGAGGGGGGGGGGAS